MKGRATKARKMPGRAKKAVGSTRVDLPPDPSVVEPMPFPVTLSDADQAKLTLRTKREGMERRVALELPTAPDINVLSYAIRFLPGGRARFLAFVKLAMLNGDPTADAFWKTWADLSAHQRRRVSFDDVCMGCGIKVSTLIAALVGHAVEHGTDVGNLIAAALHPEVVAANAKSALRIDGDHAEIALEDRKAFLQAKGFLPTPRGTQISISASATAAAASASEPSVPKFSDDLAALDASRTAVQRQIAESAIDAMPLD